MSQLERYAAPDAPRAACYEGRKGVDGESGGEGNAGGIQGEGVGWLSVVWMDVVSGRTACGAWEGS